MMELKDFLGEEQARNKTHAALFERLVKRAFGQDCDVIVGHHIGFEKHGDISTETEIPSADSLLFCMEIMEACFGEHAAHIVMSLSQMKPGQREEFVSHWLDSIEKTTGCGTRSTHLTEVA